MPAELLLPTARATDADSRVYAGARWVFYATGTTTPQAVFADADLSDSLGHIVTADSGGKFPTIYFDASLSYRGICENASGSTTLHDIDPINSGVISALAGAGGSENIGFSFAETYSDGTTGKALLGLRNVMAAPYSAAVDGVADDTAALQAAVADGVAVIPDTTLRTDTAITGDYRAVLLGTALAGTVPLDSDYGAFGPGALKVIARGTYLNSIIGIVHNTAPAGTTTFPTGITGLGRNDNAGNTAFGCYFEAKQYANTGVVTNEIDSFNYGSAATLALPPDRSIGTAQQHPIALTIGAGGTANSSIGIHIGQEGSSPQKFLTGLYVDHRAIVTYGVFIGADSTSTYTSAAIQHATGQVGIRLQGVGTPNVNGAALVYTDGASVDRFSIREDGRLGFTSAVTQSTVGVAGAATVLPSNPTGYLKIIIGSTVNVIPYYEA